ncbi:type III secretion system chaperone [Kalamiella sp. sgz302252]|uniref:type III secretion system chaperone n=1 Tax=Pantoea sp. sgz302252 TaxID=3341827 RepID=UPI0036D331FB
MIATEQLNHFLAWYGRRLNLNLCLKNGVCALVREGKEIAVVELPPESDCVILHRKLGKLAGASEAWLRTLLALNFEMDAMRGCWLAMDGDDCLRLCSQQPLSLLDAEKFSHLLNAFIAQTDEVSEFLAESRAAA